MKPRVQGAFQDCIRWDHKTEKEKGEEKKETLIIF
jgi:hypothetical protein